MDNKRKLFLIKFIHTVIWALYVIIIFYILYCGISGNIGILTYIAIALVIAEGIVLLAFRWRCPLTVVGYKYTDTDEVGFDIFIPKWLARHNKTIFTSIFGLGLAFVAIRLFL